MTDLFTHSPATPSWGAPAAEVMPGEGASAEEKAELDAAATKLQAIQKGKNDRKAVEEKKAAAAAGEGAEAAAAEGAAAPAAEGAAVAEVADGPGFLHSQMMSLFKHSPATPSWAPVNPPA